MSEAVKMPSPRKKIELLATIKSVDAEGAVTRKCFGNILELGGDALLLESHTEQNAGSALQLNVVFPGQPSRSNPVVTFHCVVRRVRDRSRMHYDLAIESMNDQARQRLVAFLSASNAHEGS